MFQHRGGSLYSITSHDKKCMFYRWFRYNMPMTKLTSGESIPGSIYLRDYCSSCDIAIRVHPEAFKRGDTPLCEECNYSTEEKSCDRIGIDEQYHVNPWGAHG